MSRQYVACTMSPWRSWLNERQWGRWLLLLPLNVRRFFLFGNCSCCGERRCNMVGPWYARHRLMALCRYCFPEGWTEDGIAEQMRHLGYSKGPVTK